MERHGNRVCESDDVAYSDAFVHIGRSPLSLYNAQVLGMGEEWLGGDMNHPGGGFKVNLLKKELSSVSDRSDLIVLFTDSYDVIFTAGAKEILAKYKRADAGILFGAEGFCWPDARLKEKYPQVVITKMYPTAQFTSALAVRLFR